MKKMMVLLPLMALSSSPQASTAYGALGNFDAVNDTGQTAYGFEIEIDDIHSTAIGGTFSYNHYGVAKIREDNTDPAHPKVFIRYEAPNPSGYITGFTNPAAPGAISPTNGHMCTNPSINQGCEHFGVGVYAPTATAYKYNWLIKDASGKTITGPAVNVGSPVWAYVPPVLAKPAVIIPNPVPNLPPIVQVPAVVQIPAQVVAAIPAPVVPIPPAKQFGEPSWVKVIKTTTHKANPLVLEDLVGDVDANNVPLWRNGEPAEVESEWYLLQTNNNGNSNKSELAGKADGMGDGSEIVTRRYEFYAYAGGNLSIDAESGEAMCDAVGADNIHGAGTVGITDANGNTYQFDCTTVAVIGDYMGAQMGEFNAVAPLALINDIQSGNVGEAFPQRSVVFGGNTPYVTTTTAGALPIGLAIDSASGVLSGTPAKVGVFNFTAEATDTDGSIVNKPYTLKVTGPGDVDVDNDIDSADLAVIRAKNGQVAKAKDPADVNGDLKINILDYRKAASLCTKPQCALITP